MVFVCESDKYRVIDYERNIVLYPKEGVYFNKGELFELHWNEDIVQFGAYSYFEYDENNKAAITWKIFQYRMPKTLEPKHDEVRQLITEALDAFGFWFTHSHVREVKVEVLPHVHGL